MPLPAPAPSHVEDDTVHVFDLDPDLLSGVEQGAAHFLRRCLVVPRLWLEPGVWARPDALRERAPLGLLVLDGLVIRTVTVDGRECPELIGAGDVLRPWDARDGDGLIPRRTTWSALERTTVALLDDRFAALAARCPSIVTQLLTRGVQRSDALAVQLAIAHVRHADTRLSMLLWHLADRWGRVTADGVHLPLALTHELLAHLACMRRPTASTALQRLVRAGELRRRADGTWLLLGEPPA